MSFFSFFSCIVNGDPLLQWTPSEKHRPLFYAILLVKGVMQGHRAPRCTTYHCRQLHQLTVCRCMADPILGRRAHVLPRTLWGILAGAEVTARPQRPKSTCQRSQCTAQWCRPREYSRTPLIARLLLLHVVIPRHRHRHRFQRQSLRSSRRTPTATENRQTRPSNSNTHPARCSYPSPYLQQARLRGIPDVAGLIMVPPSKSRLGHSRSLRRIPDVVLNIAPLESNRQALLPMT